VDDSSNVYVTGYNYAQEMWIEFGRNWTLELYNPVPPVVMERKATINRMVIKGDFWSI